jgi:septal ring factor EnvC (AmiA/AmiB activator)
MTHLRTFATATATAVASLAALSVVAVGAAPVAAADRPGDEPCAHQEQQVTKAEDGLAHVTEVFAHQQTKVERLQEALAAATTPEERARIQARLDKALARKQHVRKDKSAQLQRLAKAQARLADCLAAQPAQ